MTHSKRFELIKTSSDVRWLSLLRDWRQICPGFESRVINLSTGTRCRFALGVNRRVTLTARMSPEGIGPFVPVCTLTALMRPNRSSFREGSACCWNIYWKANSVFNNEDESSRVCIQQGQCWWRLFELSSPSHSRIDDSNNVVQPLSAGVPAETAVTQRAMLHGGKSINERCEGLERSLSSRGFARTE